jgi:biopolymer transport protein ExbD
MSVLMRYRRRRRGDVEDNASVPLSPLIDCVFLLLIFFLVTSVLKRKEKQIQVELPDNTASVAADTMEAQIVIGLDALGNPLLPSPARDKDGSYIWKPLPDLALYLKEVVEKQGVEIQQRPLQINSHRNTPFQKAIDALDLCTLQGFQRVSVKTRPLLANEEENLPP